jgi:hypothetical protein
MQNDSLVAGSQDDAPQSDPAAGIKQPVADTQTLQATHTFQAIDCVRFNRTYANHQLTSLCGDFTDVCAAERPYGLSIIKADATVISQDASDISEQPPPKMKLLSELVIVKHQVAHPPSSTIPCTPYNPASSVPLIARTRPSGHGVSNDTAHEPLHSRPSDAVPE